MSINQQREEQNVVYSYNGILFSHKKEWILVQAATGMILESIVLSEKTSH